MILDRVDCEAKLQEFQQYAKDFQEEGRDWETLQDAAKMAASRSVMQEQQPVEDSKGCIPELDTEQGQHQHLLGKPNASTSMLRVKPVSR